MTQVSNKVTHFFAKYPLLTLNKRQVLIRPDKELQSVFFIIEGQVRQYDIAPNGNEVVVNSFKQGAFFPMSSAINTTSNPYFFEAETDLVVQKAPAQDVITFLKENPDVMFDLLARVYRGVDGVLRRMAHLMGGDAKSRLIFELINAAHRFGQPLSDGSIAIALKETDLAKRSGLARETVSRILQDFKEADLVKIVRDGIVINDAKKLESLLGAAL